MESIISIHSPRMGRDVWLHGERRGEGISIHSPRMGRDKSAWVTRVQPCAENFNPLSPHGERLPQGLPITAHKKISIHSPRMGRDQGFEGRFAARLDFNPLSPHGERPIDALPLAVLRCISIHSPRMGRDRQFALLRRHIPISIHSPRMGRDPGRTVTILHYQRSFQSTLPAWGETIHGSVIMCCTSNFNPLSPHGERPEGNKKHNTNSPFQSTLPAWGETSASCAV